MDPGYVGSPGLVVPTPVDLRCRSAADQVHLKTDVGGARLAMVQEVGGGSSRGNVGRYRGLCYGSIATVECGSMRGDEDGQRGGADARSHRAPRPAVPAPPGPRGAHGLAS